MTPTRNARKANTMTTTTTTNVSKSSAKPAPKHATPTPVAAPVRKRGNPAWTGQAAMSDAEKLAAIKAREAKQRQAQKAFASLSPVAKAKRYLDSAWKGIERLGEALERFDSGDVIKGQIGACTDAMGGILDHLKTLPEDFSPARAKRGPSTGYAPGDAVYIKTTMLEKFGKSFGGNQGPHTILEVTEDREFVMLQGSRYVIGIPKSAVTDLSPVEQAEALAAWHKAHPEGLKPRGRKPNGAAKA